MSRKLLLFIVLVIGLSAGRIWALPITVENYSFELPGDQKIGGWDMEDGAVYVSSTVFPSPPAPAPGTPAEVPGWESDGSTAGSGVEPNERGFYPSHGNWAAFLFSRDPSVYNLTTHVIGIGDVYELKIDAGGNNSAADFQVALYYDDDGARVIVGSYDLELRDCRYYEKDPYSLSFAVEDPNSYNHRIGIQFDNIDTVNSWLGIDNVRLELMEPILRAININPAHGATVGTDVTLSWRAGDTADKHHVYFGEDFDDVKDGTGGTDKGLIDPNTYQLQDLVNGKTYYWLVDEVEADGTTVRPGVVWNFSVAQKTAFNPVPANGAVLVDPNVILSWSAGSVAISRDVYFGTDPESPLVEAGWSTTTYDPPDTLDYSTTYYWRIDEFDGTNTYQGDLWSFTTIREMPKTENLVGWWNFDEDVGNVAVDVSGNGNHGKIYGQPNYVAGQIDNAMEFDGIDDAVGVPRMVQDDFTLMAWIKTDQPGAGQVDQTAREGSGLICSPQGGASALAHFIMSVLNTKLAFRTATGENTVTSKIDVVTGRWVHVAVARTMGSGRVELFIDGSSDTTAFFNTNTLDNNPSIVIGANLLDALFFTGLIDEVRIYDRVLTQEEIEQAMGGDPRLAWKPNPPSGSTSDIEHIASLSWNVGEEAAEHDVYFGTDPTAVGDANESDTTGIYRGRQLETTYTLTEAFQWGKTYYWRIDEYNTDATITRGRLWNFTIADYLVVDDFEDYNETTPYKIFQTWKDGFGYTEPEEYHGNGTGSAVGSDDEPWAEQMIINSGLQSMPIHYDNSGTGTNFFGEPTNLLYSETFRQWGEPQDWTREGVKSLALWFRGHPASEGIYNAATGTITADGAGITGTADEFHFVYKELTGAGTAVIIARVQSIYNTDDWAKAGLMIRDSLDADSKHAFVCLTPNRRVSFEARNVYKGDSLQGASDVNEITFPCWVRLVGDMTDMPAGNDVFTASYSTDGSYWEEVPVFEYTDADIDNPQGLIMTDPVYIGLAFTSGDPITLGQAVFSNVQILQGNVSGEWQSTDIPSNDAEQLYIVIEDATDANTVIKHTNSNTVQLDTWTEWPIDLAEIEASGVDTKNIKKMYIGIGDRDNPVSGGFGKLYIDDIRLHRSRCVPDQAKPAGDFNDDCLVDYLDLQIMTNNWLISGGYDVTPVAPSDANLVAHYAFENNLLDGSGNGNHGDPCGAPIYVSGKIGKALELDGADDGVVTNKSLLNNLSEFTLAGWVYPTSTQVRAGLFGQNDAIEFGFWENGDLRVWTAEGGGDLNQTWTLGTLTWHHVAAVGDGTSVTIYIDGQKGASGGIATSDYGESTYGFNIGGGIWTETGYGFPGRLDDVRIYSRALSQAEVAYLAGKTTQFTQPLNLLLSPQDSAINMNSDVTIDLRDYAELVSIWLEELLWP